MRPTVPGMYPEPGRLHKGVSLFLADSWTLSANRGAGSFGHLGGLLQAILPDYLTLFNIGMSSLIFIVLMIFFYSRFEHRIIKAL